MTKELSDFFKIISEGKKKSVKEQNENESLLSNDKVSVTVKATELKDFFSAINEEKKKLKEIFSDLVPSRILERDKHPLKSDAIRHEPMKQRQINMAIWRDQYGI